MKAITTAEGFPKVLRVSSEINKKSYNKYLLEPYTEGELVKVVPFEQQASSVKDMTKERFLRQFLQIIRKDKNGQWTLHYGCTWDSLEPLTKKK